MKHTPTIVSVLVALVLCGCSRPTASLVEVDVGLQQRVIGHWVIDTTKSAPGRKRMLEARGLPPAEVLSRMDELAKLDERTRAVITADSVAVFEFDNKRELKYRWTGADTVMLRVGEAEGPATVVCPDGQTLQFADCNMSHIIWRKKNHNQKVDPIN